jgi:uncharacterized Tic20 family protein
MLNPLPRRVRLYAALCHLAGLLWITGAFVIIPLISLLGFFSLITLLFPCLTWLCTRKLHDFVDRAGREAVNAQLSVLLYTGCAVFVTALACGMKANMYTASPLGVGAAMLLFFTVPFGAMIYQIVALVAAVQSWQGNVVRYPWIIRFIPNP